MTDIASAAPLPTPPGASMVMPPPTPGASGGHDLAAMLALPADPAPADGTAATGMAAPDSPEDVFVLRKAMWANGFRPVPIENPVKDDRDTGKKPSPRKEWDKLARLKPPPATVEKPHASALNTAILCDGLRVVDIDIDDKDHAIAAAARVVAERILGPATMVRVRDNSARIALIYRAAVGEPDRIVAPGAPNPDDPKKQKKVEILGYGRQLVAFGTHYTGAKLKWENDISPATMHVGFVTVVTEEQVREFAREASFIIGGNGTITGGGVDNPRGDAIKGVPLVEPDTPEAIAKATEYLKKAEGVPEGGGRYGGRNSTAQVHAAFMSDFGVSTITAFDLMRSWNDKNEPPLDEGELESVIESAYRSAQNPFGCKHPTVVWGDAGEKLGEPVMSLIPVAGSVEGDIIPPEEKERIANLANALRMLRQFDPFMEDAFAFDKMSHIVMLRRRIMSRGACPEITARPLTDNDVTAVQERMQRLGLHRIGKAAVHDAINLRAEENAFHPVRDWLESLVWDATPRLDTWLARYMGAEASLYTAAVGRWFFLQMVARVMQPGCKADYTLVLEGPRQGEGKSTAGSILGGPWFSDSLPDIHTGKDVPQHLRGKWLVEFAELSATRKADVETTKAFLTRCEERYRPPYGRLEVTEPRQCVFIGTTNEATYLRDPTGARRFWPVRVGDIDLDALASDRAQLFAEAMYLYRLGARRWPDRGFEREHIRPQQETRRDADPWEDAIMQYVDNQNVVRIAAVAERLGLTPDKLDQRTSKRIADTLRELGWEKKKSDGAWLWRRGPGAKPRVHALPVNVPPMPGAEAAQ